MLAQVDVHVWYSSSSLDNVLSISACIQSFVVQLISATGGAALLEYTQATVTILGNDNPFGVISLQSPSAVTMEVGDNGTSVAMVTVIRE